MAEAVLPPTRSDRVMLYALALEWDLPAWFDELGAVPSISELDAWRWGFRSHGARTLSAEQMNILHVIATYARSKDGVTEFGTQVLVGTAWPSQPLIAGMLRITATTVGNALKAGEASGWLVRRRVPNRVTLIYLSLPRVLPAVTRRRSRRSVIPTENRNPVTTKGGRVPDGEQNFRRDGEELSVELTPTVESTSSNRLTKIAAPAREGVAASKEAHSVSKMIEVRLRDSGRFAVLAEVTARKLIDEGQASAV